jgi:hypothetical protein
MPRLWTDRTAWHAMHRQMGICPISERIVHLVRPFVLRFRLLALVLVSLLPFGAWGAPTSASPVGKTFDIVGTVDCGLASGKRCSIGDVVRVWTEDVSGHRQLVEIDVSWIRQTLPALDQDDLLRLEVESTPDGKLRALGVFTPDPPKRPDKEEDDVPVSQISATPTPTLVVRSPEPPGPLTLSIDDPIVAEFVPIGQADHERLVLAKSFQPPQFGFVTFTITLSGPSTNTVTVDYQSSPGSATAGSTCDTNEELPDYETISGTLTFSPGQVARTISTEICDDTIDEPDETFFVTLSNAQNATITKAQGQATILAHDDSD